MSKESNVSVDLGGGGVGGIFAAALSYLTNHSIGWMILHFFCGWFYVVYNLVVYGLPHSPVR